GGGAFPAGEQAQRHDRLRGPALAEQEGGEQDEGGGEGDDRLGVPPAGGGGVPQAVDEGDHAQGRRDRSGQVELSGPASVSGRKRGAAGTMTIPIGTLMK